MAPPIRDRAQFAALNHAGQRSAEVELPCSYDPEDVAMLEFGMDLAEGFHHLRLNRQSLTT